MSALFGAGSNGPAPSVISALYEAADRRFRYFKDWRREFSQAFDFSALQKKRCVADLAAPYPLSSPCSERLLFAIHTYFSIVVKLTTSRFIDAGHVADFEHPGDIEASQQWFQTLESPHFWRTQGLANFVDDIAFDWYLKAWTPAVARELATLIDCAGDFDGQIQPGEDAFRALYQTLVPRRVRHGLGEYYTPRWLAELTLQEARFFEDPRQRLLDPACGSGTFLAIAAAAGDDADIVGFDLNPLAVLASRANLVAARHMANQNAFDGQRPWHIPVYRRDTLSPDQPWSGEPFDLVVGNPPWIGWESLDEQTRQTTRPLWEKYGLFTLSGSQARLGGGKKDLAMLFSYVCGDRFLKSGGRLAFLITQSVFKSKGAGDGFRHFRYGDDGQKTYLKPLIVHDFSAFEPFDGATTQTAMLVVEKSEQPFNYPRPYWVWHKKRRAKLTATTPLCRAFESLQKTKQAARPVDPDNNGAPWLTADPAVVDQLIALIGDSAYQAYEGVNSGGLNGAYWVQVVDDSRPGYVVVENLADVGRIKVDKIRRTVEQERVFPLLRSGGLDRWQAQIDTAIILGQNPQTRRGVAEGRMRREFPRTYEYFAHFEGNRQAPQRGTLRGRSLFRRYFKPDDPFYSMYGVGPYTMSPWKVCWTRIDTRLRAVTVGPVDGKPVLPQETVTFVPFDGPREAYYFCALFNSSPANALVCAYSTGKGFASAHVLETLAIPAFAADDEIHGRLAALARQAHDHGNNRTQLAAIDDKIDALAAQVWDID